MYGNYKFCYDCFHFSGKAFQYRRWNADAGICCHLDIKISVRSSSDVERQGLVSSLHFNSSQKCIWFRLEFWEVFPPDSVRFYFTLV